MDAPSNVTAGQRMISIDQAYQLALDHHRHGRNGQAEQLTNQVLKKSPNHAGAWQLLAVLAHTAGKLDLAVELMSKFIKLRPTDASGYANRGEMRRLKGDIEGAIADGEVAVKHDPRLAMAHSNLGIAYYDHGDLDKAEACQRTALKFKPDFVQSLNNLGSISRDRGQREEAETFYRKALSIQNDYTEAANNLAAVLTELDRPAEAIQLLARIIRRHPSYVEAHSNIGTAFMTLENFAKAELAFTNTLKFKGDHVEAIEGLARCKKELRQLDEALALADQSLALKPDRCHAYSIKGQIFADKGDHAAAEAAYDKALELDPEHTASLIGKGHLLLELGDLAGASSLFERAQELDPESVAGYLSLAQSTKAKPGGPVITHLEKEAERIDSASPVRATSLHFALGKCYEDIKDYDRAFEHFSKGCALKRKRIPYSAENSDLIAKNIAAMFPKEKIDALSGAGDTSDLPIFVLGMPRSGTTLTETIIASHPDVFGAGELPDLLQIAARVDIEGNPGYPLNCESLDADALKTMGADYVERLRARNGEAKHITDKMPANFMALGLARLMLPNAKIVHIKRNPVDTCVSMFTKLFNRSQYHSYNLEELGRYYLNYLDIMAHWRDALPEGSFYELRYEDLVSNQEEESRKLLAYCGLTWDEACMTPHKTERSVKTASVTQVREPVYTSSVERWRRYEKHLGPLLDVLGDVAYQ